MRYVAGYYDAGGREHTKTFERKRDAEAFLAEQRVALRNSEWVDPRDGRRSLNRVWDDYAETTLVTLAPNTQRNYRAAWKHVAPVLGELPVGSIRRTDIQRFVSESSASPFSLDTAHAVLSLVLNHAIDDGLIKQNPALKVRLPKIPKSEYRTLTATELLLFADTIGEGGRGQVLMMGLAGLRWSEVAGLRAGSVDLARSRVRVDRAASAAGGKVEERETKSGRVRRLGLPKLLAQDLAPRIEGAQPTSLVYPAPGGGIDLVGNFVRRTRWEEVCKELGLGRVRRHDLRHTFASLARLGGADLRYIQNALGHQSITTTVRLYAHLYDEEPDQVARGIDRILDQRIEEDEPP